MKNKLLKAGTILAVLAVAVLVMAGSGAAATTVTNYNELKSAVEAGGDIIVGDSFSFGQWDDQVVVKTGKTVTLNLNGKTIFLMTSRFMDVESGGTLILKGGGYIRGTWLQEWNVHNGGIINVKGTFTMENVTLRDGLSNFGAAVYVNPGGKFTMNGGTITNCKVDSINCKGGAIYVKEDGIFIMNGGEISDCRTNRGDGGGIYFDEAKEGGKIELNGGTIKDCRTDGDGGAINIEKGTVTIKGVTITNCYISNSTDSTGGHGGAIKLGDGGKLDIEGGTISGCYTVNPFGCAGGAIFMGENSTANLSNLTIDGCECKTGGGGAIYVDDNQNASLKMTNCTIKNCSAKNGGAIYADEKVNITLTGCTISGCTASEHGGSVLYVNADSQSTLTDCTISGCSSTKDGGAIYVDNKGTCTISGTTIDNCNADQDGGAIFLNDKGTCTVSSTTIENCHSKRDGGAVYLDDDNTSFTMKDSSSITNCSAGKRAGAIHIDDKGSCDITDSTITGCSCDVDGGAFYLCNNGTCTVSDTTISSCHAKQDGGAIYLNNKGTCTVSSTTIKDCIADRDGGGVYLDDDNTSFTMKDNSSITGCEAQKGGGIHTNDKGKVTMEDSEITGCTGSIEGGGVYNTGTFTLKSGIISGNSTSGNGGGLRTSVKNTSTFNWENGYIKNNTTKNNTEDNVYPHQGYFNINYAGLDGATVTPENPTFFYRDSNDITLNNPVKPGDTFTGWTGTDLTGPTMEVVILNGSHENCSYTATWSGIPTYTVTFDVQGHGETPESQTVSDGEKVTKPDDPEEEGYAFKGWYTDSACTNAYDFNTQVHKDFTLYAKWTQICFVSFDMNGHGASPEGYPKSVEYGTVITRPDDPTAEGYAFEGWYSNNSCTSVYDFSTPVTGDTTIYAKWIPVYRVSFTMNGHGTQVPSQNVEEGKCATRPPDPAETGYTFDNWYRDSSCTSVYDFSTPITDNLVLYAKWNPVTFTVTFDSAGGSTVSPATVNYGGLVPEPQNVTRDGYLLTGWYKGSDLWNFAADKVYENMTLTAHWEEYDRYFPVSTEKTNCIIDAPDSALSGTTVTVTVSANDGAKLTDMQVTRSDSTEVPVSITKDSHNLVWTATFTMPRDSVTVSAAADMVTCEVTFDSNGGSAVSPATVSYGGLVSEPSVSRDGYILTGWKNGGTAWDFSTDRVYENMTLTAEWEVEPAKVYSISTQANYCIIDVPDSALSGTTVSVTVSAKNGAKLSSLQVTRSGSTAVPVSIIEDEHNLVWTATFVMPRDSVTVSAAADMVTCEVTFDSNGGTVTPEKSSVSYGNLVTEPSASLDGYILTGWKNGSTSWDFATDKVYADMTLTAEWEVKPTVVYSITLGQVQNATLYSSVKSAEEGRDVKIAIRSDSGAKVIELKYTTASEETVDLSSVATKIENDTVWYCSITMPADNITISGSAELREYTVTFDSNGGSTVPAQSVSYGGLVSEPDVARDGYILTGWYNGTTAWNFATDKVYENMTLKAGWEKEPAKFYEITLGQVQNATLYSSVKSAEEGSDVKIAIRSDSGAKVTGLNYTTESGDTVDLSSFATKIENDTVWYYPLTMPADNITISGSAEPLEYTVTFDSNGGTYVSPQTVKYGELVPEPQNVTRDGYLLTGWYNGTDLWNFATGKVYADMTLTAEWEEEEPDYYSITAEDVDNGVIYVQQKQAAGGEQISYTFTADDDYALESLTVKREDGTVIAEPAVSGESTYTGTFTMPESNVILEGTTKCDVFSVTASVTGEVNGVFTADRTKAKTGETIRFTAEPYAGYAVTDNTVTINGKEVELTMQDENSGYAEYTVLDEDVLGTASFERGIFTITVESPALPARMVTDKSTAKADEDVKIAARPGIKQTVSMFSIYDSATSELLDIAIPEYDAEKHFYSGTFSMPKADVTVKADFEDKEGAYKITKGETENGKIITAHLGLPGKPRLIKAVPDTGYHTDSVTVTDSSGQTVTVEALANDIYRFTMPASDVVVTASFRTDNPASARSTITSFIGEKDGSDFTFEKAVVITKVTLPGATYATVTNTSGSGWYTCNLATDGTNGVAYFQVPLDVIDIKGYTVNDVSMLGCRTTYLTSAGGYAKYSAVITGAGSYTIDFEKDAATAAVEKVQEVVEQKQTATEQKQAAAEKVQETVEQKQTAVEQKQTEAKTPFPILGILAGLGIAGILVMRRK